MGKIFRYQTYLKIRLTAGVDVTGAELTQIWYVKPDGTSGKLNATVEDAEEGILYYDVAPTEESSGDDTNTLINQVGNWKFWAYVEFIDGRVARGETYKVKIYDETV